MAKIAKNKKYMYSVSNINYEYNDEYNFPEGYSLPNCIFKDIKDAEKFIEEKSIEQLKEIMNDKYGGLSTYTSNGYRSLIYRKDENELFEGLKEIFPDQFNNKSIDYIDDFICGSIKITDEQGKKLLDLFDNLEFFKIKEVEVL